MDSMYLKDLVARTGGLRNVILSFGTAVNNAIESFIQMFAAATAVKTPQPPHHGFTPDYDLRCTVAHCTKTPEEH